MTQFLGIMLRKEGLPGHGGEHRPRRRSRRSRTEGFDVVITDIKMPGMDGIQVLGAIKKHRSQRCRSC